MKLLMKSQSFKKYFLISLFFSFCILSNPQYVIGYCNYTSCECVEGWGSCGEPLQTTASGGVPYCVWGDCTCNNESCFGYDSETGSACTVETGPITLGHGHYGYCSGENDNGEGDSSNDGESSSGNFDLEVIPANYNASTNSTYTYQLKVIPKWDQYNADGRGIAVVARNMPAGSSQFTPDSSTYSGGSKTLFWPGFPWPGQASFQIFTGSPVTFTFSGDSGNSAQTYNIEFIAYDGSTCTYCYGDYYGYDHDAETVTLTVATPIPATCGTASKSYPNSASSYGSDTFCGVGTPNPSSPAFPTVGTPVSWTCSSPNGGPNSPQCTASKAPAAPPTPDIKGNVWQSWIGDGGFTTPWVYQNADGPMEVYYGANYTLSWGAVANAVSCTLDGTAASPAGGSRQYSNVTALSTTRTITCLNSSGASGSDSITVTIPPPPTSLNVSCNASGNPVSSSWQLPAGYTMSYYRAGSNTATADLESTEGAFTSKTLSSTPGSTYWIWAHTKAPSAAWSVDTVHQSVTCPVPPMSQPPSSYQLNVIKSGQGAVTSSPSGISCGTDCSETYAPNTSVTLTATPASSRIFTGWGGDGTCTGRNSTCNFSMTSNKSVTANFAVDPNLQEF
jgi:hypothetical protein